jgi:lambda repressor-like predicted transcriptional regulator
MRRHNMRGLPRRVLHDCWRSKEDIAALRKRGVSYRAISELLTQSGITHPTPAS